MKKSVRYTSLRSRSFKHLLRVKVYDEIIFKEQQQIDIACFDKKGDKEFSVLFKNREKLIRTNKEINAYISKEKDLVKDYKKQLWFIRKKVEML